MPIAPTGDIHEIVDEIAKRPTLDEFLDRHPRTLTDDDFRKLISNLRADRAMFIKGEIEKKDKKAMKNG